MIVWQRIALFVAAAMVVALFGSGFWLVVSAPSAGEVVFGLAVMAGAIGVLLAMDGAA